MLIIFSMYMIETQQKHHIRIVIKVINLKYLKNKAISSPKLPGSEI